jgi:hypothetical protein
MTDSNESDPLPEKRTRDQQARLSAIKRWVDYIESTPPDVWGDQLNTLIESQLEAARDADVSPQQYRRVERAGELYAAETEDE